MEQNNYHSVSNDPMTYLYFKEEFKIHLAGYNVHSYSYEGNDVFAEKMAGFPFQSGALHINNRAICVTLHEKDGNGLIVFVDYQFDLITLKMFLEMDYLETRDISSIENFNTVVSNLSKTE